MSEKETKTSYRIRNWSKYNEALKRRGSLTFWIDEKILAEWLNEEKTGKRGASRTHCTHSGDRLLRIRRSQTDFSEWSKGRDPDGIAWQYQDGEFVPLMG